MFGEVGRAEAGCYHDARRCKLVWALHACCKLVSLGNKKGKRGEVSG